MKDIQLTCAQKRAELIDQIITIWEKLTKSNHEDVSYYKGLLREYTKEILKWMEIDFLRKLNSQFL